MCTLVVVRRGRSDIPLVVAANRDESYARPALPARIDGDVVVSGIDGRAGGTWMGATRAGVVVAVTNHRTFSPRDPSLQSRGPLVVRALEIGDPAKIAAFLERVDGREYNPFNLLFGSASSLFCAYARAGVSRIELEEVPDGVHVVPNDRLDAPTFSKVARTKAMIEPALEGPRADFDAALRDALRDHRMPPLEEIADAPIPREMVRALEATCVHTLGYGTRSATIAEVGAAGLASYAVTDGPSCVSDWVRVV